MKVIRGRTALVTGAASGIGRAIALALAREGASLCLLDVDDQNLAQTASEAKSLGVAVATRHCDLSQPDQIGAAIADLLARERPIHILVNNAGLAYYGPTHEMSATQRRDILTVNLLAPIQLACELLPVLAAQEEAHIVNVCSIFGLTTLRKGAAYSASKFGLAGFTAALRAEYSRPEFGVTALCPGFVRTAMLDSFATGTPQQRRHNIPAWVITSADYVAARAIRAIRRNEGLVVIPATARLLWRLSRLSPGLMDRIIRKAWRRRGRVEIPLTAAAIRVDPEPRWNSAPESVRDISAGCGG
jgi:3-oxoacyl-[acyl-carrier protein] reductase